MSMLTHRFCKKMLHQIRKSINEYQACMETEDEYHGCTVVECKKKDSASQVQFQPSPARAPSHLQAAAATSQVALPKTWKALNIACRMPGNTPRILVCSPTSPKKNSENMWKQTPKEDHNAAATSISEGQVTISHQLSGHLSTRRKCEGEFRYLSQTLTRLPTSLHQTWTIFLIHWF